MQCARIENEPTRDDSRDDDAVATHDVSPAPAARDLRALLFPRPPRSFHGLRAWQVAARSVHLAAMGIVLGGVAFRAPDAALRLPVALTVASGLGLLGIDLWKSGDFLLQGNGIAVLVKLALLGSGLLLPGARIECYLAATAVASVGSHMPRTWRHWSFLERRVLGTK
jgi:hypothetical protein